MNHKWRRHGHQQIQVVPVRWTAVEDGTGFQNRENKGRLQKHRVPRAPCKMGVWKTGNAALDRLGSQVTAQLRVDPRQGQNCRLTDKGACESDWTPDPLGRCCPVWSAGLHKPFVRGAPTEVNELWLMGLASTQKPGPPPLQKHPAQAAVGTSHAPRKDRRLPGWSVREKPHPLGLHPLPAEESSRPFTGGRLPRDSGGPQPAMRLRSTKWTPTPRPRVVSPRIISRCRWKVK